VLVTGEGARVLGPAIPKAADAVEAMTSETVGAAR